MEPCARPTMQLYPGLRVNLDHCESATWPPSWRKHKRPDFRKSNVLKTKKRKRDDGNDVDPGRYITSLLVHGISHHSRRTQEDAETFPRVTAITAVTPQTIQDRSLTLVNKGNTVDHLTSYRISRVLGIATYCSTPLASLILSEPACYETPSTNPTVSWHEQTYGCHGWPQPIEAAVPNPRHYSSHQHRVMATTN